jgi:uncharacterized membrane protein YedE/YeeE
MTPLATTLYAEGALGSPAGLVAAAAIGAAFGFWLERAGFGSSRKLTSIFYFRDFAVLKVMFTAIVTALVGLEALTSLGVLARDDVFRPETFLGPQIVGGLIFGAGFVVGGWCPGTALVGTASGKADALAFLAGAGGGSLLYAFAYPALADFAASGAQGVCAWPEALGIPRGIAVLLVIGMALGAFLAAEKVEALFARRAAAAEAPAGAQP